MQNTTSNESKGNKNKMGKKAISRYVTYFSKKVLIMATIFILAVIIILCQQKTYYALAKEADLTDLQKTVSNDEGLSENEVETQVENIAETEAFSNTEIGPGLETKESEDNLEQSQEENLEQSEEIEATEATNELAKMVEGITPTIRTLNTTAYCACKKCCGNTKGITASGEKVQEWHTVAAGKEYKIGTIIYIPAFADQPNGGWFVVQDRGSAIKNGKLDIYMNTHQTALEYGRKHLECYVYEF